jgi:Crinkler effector protein N-terminal domain
MSTATILRCWVHGDDPDYIFPVEIAATKTVGDLKKAIKEEKKHAFRDVDADILVLWKVSIAFDDSFNENLKNLDLDDVPLLSARRKLSAVGLDQPTDDQLNIVIKAPVGERSPFSVFMMIPDLTSLPEKCGSRAASIPST